MDLAVAFFYSAHIEDQNGDEMCGWHLQTQS